ncbi:MAG: diphthine--ammonia ligase [Nitrosarchaeum sp.]|nr:diphthine--ammonia ligase [Nitrosarchaeum sp.]
MGVLFSGGISSLLLARILQQERADVTYYCIGTERSPDLQTAQTAAHALGLRLTTHTPTKEHIETALKTIPNLISDTNPAKVSAGLITYLGSELAARDANIVLMTGSGANEAFGGHQRNKNDPTGIMQDCHSNLLKHYETSAYRDDVLAMRHGLELRVPYLDTRVTRTALLHTPGNATRHQDKHLLHIAADLLGIPRTLHAVKQRAPHYGSGTDRVFETLAKNAGQTKAGYLRTQRKEPNTPLAVLLSTGKDSLYAAYTIQQLNYELRCAVTLRSENPHSYMFHTPAIELAALQAHSMGLAHVVRTSTGAKEDELQDLKEALRIARDTHGCQGIVTGAIASTYQRDRIEAIADALGLKIYAPLWHIDQEEELRGLLRAGFRVILTAIAADGTRPQLARQTAHGRRRHKPFDPEQAQRHQHLQAKAENTKASS